MFNCYSVLRGRLTTGNYGRSTKNHSLMLILLSMRFTITIVAVLLTLWTSYDLIFCLVIVTASSNDPTTNFIICSLITREYDTLGTCVSWKLMRDFHVYAIAIEIWAYKESEFINKNICILPIDLRFKCIMMYIFNIPFQLCTRCS